MYVLFEYFTFYVVIHLISYHIHVYIYINIRVRSDHPNLCTTYLKPEVTTSELPCTNSHIHSYFCQILLAVPNCTTPSYTFVVLLDTFWYQCIQCNVMLYYKKYNKIPPQEKNWKLTQSSINSRSRQAMRSILYYVLWQSNN